MASQQFEDKQKHPRHGAIIKSIQYAQKRLPCGVLKCAIVDNFNSWTVIDGEEGFQDMLDRKLIIRSDFESPMPRYILNPAKFPDPDSTK